MPIDVKTILESSINQAIYGVASGTFANNNHNVLVSVSNASITDASRVLVTVAIPSGRDIDEMEFAPVSVSTQVVSASGFNIIGVSLDGDADGTYLFNYTALI